ncbi:hypothetical protein BV881_34005 [Streptomyces sp. ZL-24]|nr:hypothetical protein BV881_34005 [Streptomyces sp. ZL-24]
MTRGDVARGEAAGLDGPSGRVAEDVARGVAMEEPAGRDGPSGRVAADGLGTEYPAAAFAESASGGSNEPVVETARSAVVPDARATDA